MPCGHQHVTVCIKINACWVIECDQIGMIVMPISEFIAAQDGFDFVVANTPYTMIIPVQEIEISVGPKIHILGEVDSRFGRNFSIAVITGCAITNDRIDVELAIVFQWLWLTGQY